MSTAVDALPLSKSSDALPEGRIIEARPSKGPLDLSSIPRSGSGLPSQIQQSEGSNRISNPIRAIKPLVILWITKVLQLGGETLEVTQDDTIWNELRYGQLPCKALNALSPKTVRHINSERSPMAALENLAAFSTGLTTFGINKTGSFRPMEFVNASPVGDEGMVKALAALAVHVASSMQISVPDVPIDRIRYLLEGGDECEPALLNGAYAADQIEDAEGQNGRNGSQDSLERLLDKLKTVESNQSRVFRRAATAELKLRHTIRGITDPSYRQQESATEDAKEAIQKADSLADELISTIGRLLQNVKDLETSQQNILGKVGNLALAERIATIDEEVSSSAMDFGMPIPRRAMSVITDSDRQKSQSSISLASEPSFVDASKTRMSIDSAAPAASPGPPKTMFSKLPPEVAGANLPKPELMRLSAVYELIETEADYVRDLSLMINFHKPQLQETQLLTEEEIQALFSNIDQLVPVNQQLLDRLHEKRDTDPFIPEVGDAIVDVSESFKVYTIYCGNYPEAMKLVHKLQARPDLKEKLETMMNSQEGRGLSLESFLIKPVQRICKYPLLIRELQKHTDKLSKDTISLNLAMTKIESVVALVNEYTRQLGERERIAALQGRIDSPTPLGLQDKKHVRDGPLARAVNGKPRERYALLFTDVLLVCTPLKGGRYVLESVYDVADLALKVDAKGEGVPKGMKHGFQITGTADRKDLIFAAASEDDRQKWIDAFNTAIKVAAEESRKADNINKRMSTGAFLAHQFNSAQDDSDRGSVRPSSWSMGMGGRRPVSRAGSTLGVGGSLRGTLKGWGTLRRKDVDFANLSQGSIDVGPNAGYSETDMGGYVEPDMVDIGGQIWKKATSAMGTTYYYNTDTKEAMWRLPENYIILDPETGKPFPEDSENAEEVPDEGEDVDSGDETELSGVESVEGYPDWRKVDRGDEQIYYFNVITQETSWTPPNGENNTESGVADT
ncbi:uncharacterized protein SPPG_06473 [Spizellomyces punctatus DAOM BR117]|uniref:RhoGEF domain-containing protein n=1 Tax=Spizellomyces punctatus (strain DAOM BR117) TaxID=645134 RepID=A0A0L0HB27_SPIPD|nr:uncharacterized protein SPPG_06473 [Spizellomyces punctatus DAOM BR117]KNC98059.1 hypothetical protein SPPG_06473 [Spizellomyces punctatus DAOM BR117]|eukprot:XP_016606099.1 hypothetical protein SPPG_06473 [Spizellomyces punctatus DAOM BR117]